MRYEVKVQVVYSC